MYNKFLRELRRAFNELSGFVLRNILCKIVASRRRKKIKGDRKNNPRAQSSV